jgi:hypothetical protein
MPRCTALKKSASVHLRVEEYIESGNLVIARDSHIAEHGGDARQAIRSLLEMVSYLEAARDRALALVSYGYGRGKIE